MEDDNKKLQPRLTPSMRERVSVGQELVPGGRSPPSNKPSRGTSSDFGLQLPSVSNLTRAQKNWQIARRAWGTACPLFFY
jgi:hypothetical protein